VPLFEGRDRLHSLPGSASVACCQACGLGVTLPVVEAAQLSSLYPSTYATYETLPKGALGLLSKAAEHALYWQAMRSAPLDRLAAMPSGRLLDIGCGRGDLGSWFARRGWSVVGIEPSAQACEVARMRGVDARTGTLDTLELELERQTYDAAVFRHSLEHVADPVADLRRAREALRYGGVAIVSVPNFGCWQRHRFGARWFHLDLPRHRVHFDAGSLRTALALAGFARVETSTSSTPTGLPASLQYALAGRCLFPDGWKLRAAYGVCELTAPLSRLANRLAGEGDVLHAAAYAR
jgi:2-polyprenyl-3-methyl-5-hydroxy-6-metoxy-1,4-benzoquinol methylase